MADASARGRSGDTVGWLVRRSAALIVATTAVFSLGFVVWSMHYGSSAGIVSQVDYGVTIVTSSSREYTMACPYPLSEDGSLYPLDLDEVHSSGTFTYFLTDTTRGPALVVQGRGEVSLCFVWRDTTPIEEPRVLMSMTTAVDTEMSTSSVFSTAGDLDVHVWMSGQLHRFMVDDWSPDTVFTLHTDLPEAGWSEISAAYRA